MPPNRFESEVESFLEGSHGDRTHIKRADHPRLHHYAGRYCEKNSPNTAPPAAFPRKKLAQHRPSSRISAKKPAQHSPSTYTSAKKFAQHRPSSRISAKKTRPASVKTPILGCFERAGRTISRSHPPPDHAGRTFSHTRRNNMATLKPPTPLLVPNKGPLKPTTPLHPKTAPKTPISHPQR